MRLMMRSGSTAACISQSSALSLCHAFSFLSAILDALCSSSSLSSISLKMLDSQWDRLCREQPELLPFITNLSFEIAPHPFPDFSKLCPKLVRRRHLTDAQTFLVSFCSLLTCQITAHCGIAYFYIQPALICDTPVHHSPHYASYPSR